MLRIGNNIIRGVYKGTTKIATIYKGGTKVFPCVEYVNTGEDVGSWSYPNNYTRVRTRMPWSQEVFQDGSYGSKVYGTSYQQSETALTSYIYGIWNYSSGNESRYRDVAPKYTFSDGYTITGGSYQELESGIPSYSYGTWNYYDGNSYRNRAVSTTYSYTDGVVLSGSTYTSSNEYGTSSYGSWTYYGSIRKRYIYYSYDSGSTVKTGPLFEESATITYGVWDGSTYWNGACGTNYYFIDYKKVRDQYSYNDATTYSDYYNGESRSRRIDGQCGWVRAWTNWTNTGSTCNANGVAGQYSCDNTWSVTYYQQVRYYQYPDGTGRTNTEYRAGAEYSRVQTNGQCGYTAAQPRREWEYYGYSDYSPEDAWWNCYDYPIGILYQDTLTGLYYSEPTGENLAAPGFYVLQKGFDVDYSIICEVW